MKILIRTKLLALFTAVLPFAAVGQINYSGGIYAQDFDTLRSDAIYTYYTNLPAGWSVSAIQNSYVWTTVTNGYSNNYGVYCFSLESGAANKSIGIVRGSTGAAYVGARFRNVSGVTLRVFSLSYFAEQWLKGGISSSDQTIPFSYSLNATSLTSGTYVNVPALDMHSIHDGDGITAVMNGNLASNRQLVTSTVSGIAWLPNQDLWIRWSGATNSFFTAHALAIDDLTFRTVPQLQISSVSPTTLRFSWSTNYPGYVLESANTPNPVSWDAVTHIPAVAGGNFSIELQAADAQRLFRLKKR